MKLALHYFLLVHGQDLDAVEEVIRGLVTQDQMGKSLRQINTPIKESPRNLSVVEVPAAVVEVKLSVSRV